jgi:chromate transporter
VRSPLAGPGPAPTLGAIYRGFFHAGARGFGGVLPWAYRMLVEERRWLTARQFTDLFGLCNFLPGPNTVNLSIVVGARFHGARGSATALAGILTLPLGVVLALAVLYDRFGQLPGVDAALRGLGAAAGGLVLATGLRMAAPLLRRPRPLAFLAVTFAAVALLRWPLLPVLLTLAPLSVLAAWLRRA